MTHAAEATDTLLTAGVWVVGAAALALSVSMMASAFGEAKEVVDRRADAERQQAKKAEDAEAARKQKIKDMFERL